MNHITFIVGNGMDIQLGLPTSYLHFYKWMKIHHHDVNNIFLPPKDENIIDIKKEWSDFENKFVDIINTCFYILNEDSEKLSNIDSNQVEYYKNYMLSYYENVNSNDNLAKKIAMEFYKFIEYFEKYLIDIERYYVGKPDFEEKVKNICQDLVNIDKNFKNRTEFIDILKTSLQNAYTKRISLVSLNYTNIINNISKKLGRNVEVFLGGNKYNFQQSKISPLHLHGEIRRDDDDDNFIIGTHSLESLNQYILKTRQKNLFSKKEVIEKENGRPEYKRLSKILEGEQLIIVYGLSLGISDKILMEKVLDKLLNSKSLLIIYGYDEEYKGYGTTSRTNFYKTDLLPEIFKFNNYTEKQKEKIDERIFVVPIDQKRNLISQENQLIDNETRDKIVPSSYQGNKGEKAIFDNLTYVNMNE